MTNHQAEKYLAHKGHKIEVVTYGRDIWDGGDGPVNVSIECEDCCEVLTDEEV